MPQPRLSRTAEGAVELPLDAVAPDPEQPRSAVSPRELAELAESLRAHRVIQPIVVTPHPDAAARRATPYMILAGERRWRAARLAGFAAIPAIVRREKMSPADRLLAQIAENEERSPLGLLDRALAYRRAHQQSGLSLCAFAARCGKTKGLLSQLLRIASARGPLRKGLEQGFINHLTAARIFERLPAATQRRLLDAARRNGRPMTARRLRAVLASGPAENEEPAPRPESISISFTYPMLRANLRYFGAKPLPTLEAAAAQLLKLIRAGLESPPPP